MLFSVSKSALCQALSLVAGVAEKRTTIPILNNVRLHADAGALTITGTDLDLALTVRTDADVSEPGVTTLPARKLYDYARLLPEGEIRFKVDERSWATISAGRSRTRIPGTAPDAFPDMPAVPELEQSLAIPSAVLISLTKRVQFAISTIESRFTLNAALFESSGGRVYLVATDGHRLAFAGADLPDAAPMRLLMPANALKHLQKLAAAEIFRVSQDENHVFISAGSAILTARKMAGNFPDYARVLPKESTIKILLNRADLAGAISRVAQFADERSRSVKLSLTSGTLEVFASTTESGDSTEMVQCDFSGPLLEVGFNGQYISDFLGVVESESVVLCLTDAKSAGELRPAGSDDYRYVVMPMRI